MAYSTVLVAVEPNDEAAAIVARAQTVAPTAEVSVVAVLPDAVQAYGTAWTGGATAIPISEFVRDARLDVERQLRDRLRHLVDESRVAVRFGHPATAVHDAAREIGADCLVAGCHGQHGIELAFGSTANALIHGLDCDAFFVRMDTGGEPASRKPHRQAVIAVDATDEAHEVVEAGQAFIGPVTTTTLMTVVKSVAHTYGNMLVAAAGGGDVRFEERALHAAGEWLGTLADGHGLSAETLAVVGSPAQEISRHARDTTADLIVVGSHGRHGLGRLLGSTANGVLHGVACDVLVVRVGGG